jgi:hypothetical protein
MIFLQSVASSVPLLHDDNTLAINELPPFCLAWSNSPDWRAPASSSELQEM